MRPNSLRMRLRPVNDLVIDVLVSGGWG
jgi:hypothetical protein